MNIGNQENDERKNTLMKCSNPNVTQKRLVYLISSLQTTLFWV